MNTKALSRVEIKDADKGQVEAVFATFDVIDHDMDVTPPDAFTDGQKTRISAYGHASHRGALPVGKGVVRTSGTEAVLEGQFFLDTQAGRDTFTVVKEMGDLQEWSYAFDVEKYSYGEFEGRHVRFLEKMKVNEVSPVLLGAGIDTRTLSAKSGLKFSDEAEAVLADLKALSDRAADVLAKRREKGKGFGSDTAELLRQVEAEAKRLGGLLATPEPVPEWVEEIRRADMARLIEMAHQL